MNSDNSSGENMSHIGLSDENIISCNEKLSLFDMLGEGDSLSVLYSCQDEFPAGINPDDILQKTIRKSINPMPYIAFADLNNTRNNPYENKPKNAIEIGLKFTF